MNDVHEETTTTPEETQALAAHVVEQLTARESNRGTSTIVALSGELGAGKTVFVKGVAEALGVTGVVTSPTFVIQKIYKLPEGAPWKHLVHIDAYRLETQDELATIGWYEIATNPGNLVMIEWPEKVGMGIPERAYAIAFHDVDETTRKITCHV